MDERKTKKPAYEVVFESYSANIADIHGVVILPHVASIEIPLLETILLGSEIPPTYHQYMQEQIDVLIETSGTNYGPVHKYLESSLNRVRESLSQPEN